MGRKKKSKPEAVPVQHRGSGWLPQPPTIIFDLPPVVLEATEQSFKDTVQLHTGSPRTQAAAAARLGCDVPARKPRYGRRPSPSRSPPPANAIPGPSLATAVVPFEVAAGGRNSQDAAAGPYAASAPFVSDDYATTSTSTVFFYGGRNSQEDSSYVPPDLSPQGAAPFRRNEEGHLAAAWPYAASAPFVSDDYATTSTSTVFSMDVDGGVPRASAGALSPSSSSSMLEFIDAEFVPDDDAVSFQHNQELLLAAGGQNSTQQCYSYVPPDPSLPDAVPFRHNQQLLLAGAGGQNTQQYFSYIPPNPSLPFQHNENGHLAATMPCSASASFVSDHHATTSAAVFPRVSPSSSIIFMSDGDLGNRAASAGAAVRVFNGNDFAGARATRPSSQAKLATSNSHANVVQKFLEEDDNKLDWKWIFNRFP